MSPTPGALVAVEVTANSSKEKRDEKNLQVFERIRCHHSGCCDRMG
jgi:hypothetical protein